VVRRALGAAILAWAVSLSSATGDPGPPTASGPAPEEPARDRERPEQGPNMPDAAGTAEDDDVIDNLDLIEHLDLLDMIGTFGALGASDADDEEF
jgi:hypothetical protein